MIHIFFFRVVLDNMFHLWCLVDADLLSEKNVYSLRSTGQGVHRLQKSPNVARAISELLGKLKQGLGSWVGSSVIHLGDANVPNALIFIDKYSQVNIFINNLGSENTVTHY